MSLQHGHIPAGLFPRDISLWKAWDWLLGLVPSVPGKEISWKTALAVAVLAGVTPGAGSGALPGEMLHKAAGPEAGNGINMAQAALRERNWTWEHLPSICQLLPAGQYKALNSKDHKSWLFGGGLIPHWREQEGPCPTLTVATEEGKAQATKSKGWEDLGSVHICFQIPDLSVICNIQTFF